MNNNIDTYKYLGTEYLQNFEFSAIRLSHKRTENEYMQCDPEFQRNLCNSMHYLLQFGLYPSMIRVEIQDECKKFTKIEKFILSI